MFGNPYTPGAGCVPPFLAGRDSMLNSAQSALEHLKEGYPQRSILFYGLRGVGKTALLNAIEEFADNLGVTNAHIEATEDRQFIKRLVTVLGRCARSISVTEALKEMRSRCLKLLESVTFTYAPIENNISMSLSPDDNLASGDLADDLTELIVLLGKIASKSHNALCIFIDEAQIISTEHARALISAVHRCNQLRLPVMLCCAGLPKAIEVMNKACSYSERMFEYVKVDRLLPDEAMAAISEPAKDLGVQYSPDALASIVKSTSGYPYYIQEYCSVIWDGLRENTRSIELEDVIHAKDAFLSKLDGGFFEGRYSRCSPSERRFMLAMTECATTPCVISEVAEKMKKSVQQISPFRATLIDKGIIYAPARGEVDFTVPMFDDYLRRVTVEESEQ